MEAQPRFYCPIDFKIGDISVIVYPAHDENPLEPVFGRKSQDLLQYVEDLYKKTPSLKDGRYHIVFLWVLDGKRMADVWVHRLPQSDGLPAGSGPVVTCYNFQEFEPNDTAGMASADSLGILGAEAALVREFDDIDDFAHNPSVYPLVTGIRRAPRYGESSD